MKENESENQHKDIVLSPLELNEWWEKITFQLREIEKQKKRRQIRVISVIIILLSLGGVIGYDTLLRPDVFTAEKGNRYITLRDGTTVTLYRGGILREEKSLLSKTREVALQGDAVFRVTPLKDRPFIVHANGYEARVLGTVFKVTQGPDGFKLDLYEGKVAVTRNGEHGEAYVLSPQQRFTNYGSEKVAAVTPLQESVSGRIGSTTLPEPHSIRLQFTGCHLAEAVSVIEKIYGLKVQFPASYKDKLISMNLSEMTGEEVLENIALTLGLQLTKYDQYYQLEN